MATDPQDIRLNLEQKKLIAEIANKYGKKWDEVLGETIRFLKSLAEGNGDSASNAVNHDTDDAFGIWRDRKIDGLDYQRRIRNEWS